MPAQDADSIQKAVPRASVVSYIGNELTFLFFSDVSSPQSPFNDVRMRQAASLSLDRNALLDLIFNG